MAENEFAQPDELSKSQEDTLLESARTRFQLARDHWKDWREEARQCFEFYNGHQWSQDDIEYLESQLRVPITFNRAGVYIDAVLGHEANNRQELKYIPRTQGDAAVNEIVTEVARYYTDECDGEYADSEAFKHMLICGIGWTETRLDDTENPDYDLVRECVSPMHILPDPTSERPCFSDARYVFKLTQHSKEEAKYMFPDWDGVVHEDYEWDFYDDEWETDTGTPSGPRDSYLSNDGETDDPDAGRDVTIVQYQYKDYEDVWMAKDPASGKEKVITDSMYEQFGEEMKNAGIEVRKKKRVVCKVCYIIGSNIVHSAIVCRNDFTLQAVTGKRDITRKTWQGLMYNLLDVQQWSNKFLSQMLHIINSQAKGGLDVEESAISNQEEFEARYSQPGALLVYRDGALQNNRVRERSSVQFPAQFERLLQYANSSFGDVAGINSELLGMADREQPGVLEYQRRQSAVSLLAPLFDSLRLYRKRMGRVWLYFIQKYLADNRIARITVDPLKIQEAMGQQQMGQMGPNGQPMPQMPQKPKMVSIALNPRLIGDPEVAKYDIIVDQAASAPNQKEATWAVLTQLGPLLQDTVAQDPTVLMKFLEYSPLPESLLEELKTMADQRMANPKPSPEEKKIQLEGQKMQMEQQKDAAKLQMDREAKMADMQMEKERHQMQMAMEQQKMVWEREKFQMKMQMEAAKAKMNMNIDLMRAENETELAQYKAVSNAEIAAYSAQEKAKNQPKPSKNGKAN